MGIELYLGDGQPWGRGVREQLARDVSRKGSVGITRALRV
jgi:hypothetical protein